MAVASPFFQSLPLSEHGLEWIHPDIPFAHPLDDGSAAVLERSVEATADRLGVDGRAYRRLMGPLVAKAYRPSSPICSVRFVFHVIRSWRCVSACAPFARGRGSRMRWFETDRARAIVAGLAAHAVLPLEQSPGAAIAVMLGLAGHAVGWPFPRGGSQRIADALASYFRSLGGEIVTGWNVNTVDELPPARAVLLDVTPRQLLALAEHRLPDRYRRRISRYRYGPGVFKIDWALSGPIPWRAEECRQAGTVHVGGTLEEVARSEREAFQGQLSERPFVLLAQPSLFDLDPRPVGQHTAWGYCHVPHGSTIDMTERIEAQIERLRLGFRDRILARHTMNTAGDGAL